MREGWTPLVTNVLNVCRVCLQIFWLESTLRFSLLQLPWIKLYKKKKKKKRIAVGYFRLPPLPPLLPPSFSLASGSLALPLFSPLNTSSSFFPSSFLWLSSFFSSLRWRSSYSTSPSLSFWGLSLMYSLASQHLCLSVFYPFILLITFLWLFFFFFFSSLYLSPSSLCYLSPCPQLFLILFPSFCTASAGLRKPNWRCSQYFHNIFLA